MPANLSPSGPGLELNPGAARQETSEVEKDVQLASTVIQEPPGQKSILGTASTTLESSSSNLPKEETPAKVSSDLVRYRIEYVGRESGSSSVDGRTAELDNSKEPPVLEYVEVRLSSQKDLSSATKADDIKKTDKGKGRAYINILSPAVAEALRCVVDYFPEIDLSGNVIKILEPYSVFIFFEKELTEYCDRVARPTAAGDPSCPNRWAVKHINIVQDFVRQKVQDDVDAERARHAKGYATFDMLWLLYKPGSDVYHDSYDVGEHEPYVVSGVNFGLVNGATNYYELDIWNINADSEWVGPKEWSRTIQRFAGEKRIPSLTTYPCEYLRFADGIAEEDSSAIKQHFVNRGKKWYNLRRKIGCYAFDGVAVPFPRRVYSGLSMVDPIRFVMSVETGKRTVLSSGLEQPSSPLRICTCKNCEETIYQHAVKPKFQGYIKVNPLLVESMTDHQYFLCDQAVEAFLFNLRTWTYLHVDGFREPFYDSTLLDSLVMKSSTKELIKDLTQRYIGGSGGSHLREDKMYRKVTEIHKPLTRKKADSLWSPDFIEGKGEGLTILLHGGPGVGKTYTAECIAEFTGRPLLALTCSDIGVKPEAIEENLVKWFEAAKNWGAIMLIDEADIYMEERKVQDIERNHLVAGFLRALEYYKGILFLTTNRVGTFDEAFMSRIHIQIHYPDFSDEERDRLWHTFFEKLEEDRETTMRITQSAKDYVQSQEMRALKWNGREIRNAFQVAVALAEAQGQKDKEGRVLIKSEHIKATVQMSREFRDYLVKLYKVEPSKRASLMGNRYDAYGKDASTSTGKY